PCALARPRSAQCRVRVRLDGWNLGVRLGKSTAGIVELGFKSLYSGCCRSSVPGNLAALVAYHAIVHLHHARRPCGLRDLNSAGGDPTKQELSNLNGARAYPTKHEPGNWNGVGADPTKQGLGNLNVARADPTEQELGNWDGTRADLTEHELGNWNGMEADPTKQGLGNLNVARADPTE
ncbi:hypothetical protein BHE74_00058544, partial [Ensete ventricosum]